MGGGCNVGTVKRRASDTSQGRQGLLQSSCRRGCVLLGPSGGDQSPASCGRKGTSLTACEQPRVPGIFAKPSEQCTKWRLQCAFEINLPGPYLQCPDALLSFPVSINASPHESLVVLDREVSIHSRQYLDMLDIRSVFGAGRFRWYLLPPGAVGGTYGSGCLKLSNSCSVCSMISFTNIN